MSGIHHDNHTQRTSNGVKEYLPQKTAILKISRFFLVILLAFSWISSGWPQIFNFPPGIQIAQATDTTPTISGTGANATPVEEKLMVRMDDARRNYCYRGRR